MTNLNAPTCATCRFWDKHSNLPKGYSGNCRAKSPIASPDDSSAWWPISYNTDWCGEHQPRPTMERDNE